MDEGSLLSIRLWIGLAVDVLGVKFAEDGHDWIQRAIESGHAQIDKWSLTGVNFSTSNNLSHLKPALFTECQFPTLAKSSLCPSLCGRQKHQMLPGF